MLKYMLAVLLSLATPVAAQDIVRISIDRGGINHEYFKKIRQAQGKLVIIDGICSSACTFYLHHTFIKLYDICATDNAQIGFHKPYTPGEDGYPMRGDFYVQQSESDWYIMKSGMPDKIRDILDRAHIPNPSAGDPTDEIYWIDAPTLQSAIGKCS